MMQRFLPVHSLFRLTLLVIALTGCAYKPSQNLVTPAAAAFNPGAFNGGTIYIIDPDQSDLQIRVYRAGTFAALGHHHIIRAPQITGQIYLHPEIEKSGVTIQIPVNDFIVDEKELRKSSGVEFSSVPSALDIAGTRSNMLGPKILNASQYPYINIISVTVAPQADILDAVLRVSLRGIQRDIRAPVTIQQQGAEKISATGSIRILQTDFGIKPFSILLGAIAIQNELQIDFRITAKSAKH